MRKGLTILSILFCSNSAFAQGSDNNIQKIFDDSFETKHQEVKRKLRLKILTDAPDSAYGVFSKAWLSDDTTEQFRLYSEAIEKKSDFWQAFQNRGFIYKKRGEFKAAADDFREVLKINPKAVRIEFEIALCIMMAYEREFNETGIKGDDTSLHEALSFINSAIRNGTDDGDATSVRAFIKSYLGDHRGSIDDFNTAIKQQPKRADFWTGRAWAFLRLKKMKESERDANQAIVVDPKGLFAYLIRGIIRMERGEKVAGCKDFSFAGENGLKKAYTLIRQFCQ